MLNQVKRQLDSVLEVREKAMRIQREVVPLCAQTIRDVHGGKRASAEQKVKLIERKIAEAEGILKQNPEIVNSVLGIAYQEYAELAIFLSYLKSGKLPKLSVPPQFYLTGLGDAIGEIKREGLELLAKHDLKGAEALEGKLEELYAIFASFSYPNSIVPGMKHKQDVARGVINAFHDQILAHKLTRPR